ncbi:unnamed protein product [Phaedon cochleariae]|uniref:Uncharacterized protein n=1 Tax=Phaedon cochleariae TaxID=80249 RepID=A0A9N9SJ28_PHACE|nr:unnamed protein product [Phaedon cochleariae]
MRGKWTNSGPPINVNRSSSMNRRHVDEPVKPIKFLHHSPSLKAIRAYNDLPVEGGFQNGIDLCLFSPQKYDSASVSRISIGSDTKSNENNLYEYATMGTLSVANSMSELNSEIHEMGSTLKLVPSKMELSCQTWMYYISTALCTMSMALGLGNLYRLPQVTMIRGGLPFLIAHLILTVFIGLPLLFLELGFGQLAQEGFIKYWKAVPFFKGIGYVKFLAGCLLSLYYPLYMALSLFYVIWVWKGSMPFQECSAGVKITNVGYSTYGKNGQQCIKATFLKSPFEDPSWYGIYAGLLLMVWIVITILSFAKTRSYIKSLIVLIFPTLGLYITLFVKSISLQTEYDCLGDFFTNADWSLLTSANTWYYAAIQVFFSTTVGFGSFVTNAGIIYNKVNPFWTALGFTAINLIFGAGSVIISQSLANNTRINISTNSGAIAELYLPSLIYDIGSHSTSSDIKTWTILVHAVFILSGFISMATLTYTLLKAITVASKKKLKWWHASVVLSFLGYVLGCAILLKSNFDIVHLLDHYIVGNLIIICVIIEIMALIAFYGTERIKSDFEFMLGHILSNCWLVLWWISPLILTALFAWGMITLPLEGIFKDDPSWLYGIGWGVVLIATFLIFVIGFYVVYQQDGYTLEDKMKTSVKPSKNWGPKDPISRHNWVQWNSKAQHGERDFTLKRKGTKDYTRSIKKIKKTQSEVTPSSIDGVYKESNGKQSVGTNNGSNIYTELYDANANRSTRNQPPIQQLQVSSVTDSVTTTPSVSVISNGRFQNEPQTQIITVNGTIPEEYGTFRKGPYIIKKDNMEHVCFRKFSDNENATEL